jgi:hypothetical protein
MRKQLLFAAMLFITTYAHAFGDRYRANKAEGGYFSGGLAGMIAGKAPLGGFELLASGNLLNGWLLAGVNAGVYRGESPDKYDYSIPNASYKYHAYNMGLNLGVRLVYTDNFSLTLHAMAGAETLAFGYKDSSGDCHCGRYHNLLTDNFWYVRPVIGINNRRNFTVTASYNFLFSNDSFNSGDLAFGDNASDFDGPVLSLIWITNSRYHYHYHSHHRC